MSRCAALIFSQRTFSNVYDPDISKCSGQMRALFGTNIWGVQRIDIQDVPPNRSMDFVAGRH